MRRIFFPIVIFFLGVILPACQNKHFLKEESYRQQVHKQFEKRQVEAVNRSEALFSVFEKEDLSLEQREALEFLYAYMPLNDLADYDGEFFLKQVDAAFQARDYFSWGKTVPDDIFRHFVLVYRVNNENLDTARVVFFNELKDRVKGLSMYNAALEVNHWCHEKVTYRGTDGRTSAPLALMRTSWGRCGEESTFTTAALRAVGIPARQCYTPRWVHTDDNHAWVEVWIDGDWHYLGACEPEPELDVAWFSAPAKRAMMVHSTVFGLYSGSEEKNVETPLYSKINLLKNYAETRVVNVQVTDENNQAVEGARVQFKVYNYAELYAIAESLTDKEGKASIISGKGDLMIWANKGDYYGYTKSELQDEITVVKLTRQAGACYEESFVMNVPPEQTVKTLSSSIITANAQRLAAEDSIRTAYMNTFITEKEARNFAGQNCLNLDETWKYLHLAQGNWQEIKQFMLQAKENQSVFDFLGTLTEKDLRDTPADYLNDHLNNIRSIIPTGGESVFSSVFSPRIELEIIQPWRNYLIQKITEISPDIRQDNYQQNVDYIIDFVKKQIQINDEENYYNCRISPRGVYELRIADRVSRNIFFVALCRSFGIPARIEPATGKPQYYDLYAADGQLRWIDLAFEPEEPAIANVPKTKLIVQNAGSNITKPGYYTHYTLAVFKDGDFQTLDFEDSPLVANFPYSLELDEGYYRLMVGSRANDGSVSVSARYFNVGIDPNFIPKSPTIEIRLPETTGKLFVKGIVDMNTLVTLNGEKQTLKELARGKGLMLCFIDPGKEPSKHILQDFPSVQQALERWGGGILLMTPDDKISKAFDRSAFKGLPEQTTSGTDEKRQLLKAVTGALQLDFQNDFPLSVYLSRNGGILYSSVGYQIGTGENILKIIQQEK